MADEETANNHPETSASTPNSASGGPQSGTKAPKDRSCPFCGQAFTSSSLGRHLDLYIKPRNPKPPDGVHDVDEIRKIRGNITRRQPRTSARVSVDTSREECDGRKPQSHVAEDSPIVSPVNAKDIQEGQTLFNHANWQATGVINNIPQRAPSTSERQQGTGQAKRIEEMRRDTTSGNRIQRPEYESESMWRLQQDAELGRAAEMALREVLGSLEAANKRIEPKSLYDDFDFHSLSFPGLCLAILPPPSTLFSPTPFPSAESWTLSPPGLRQFEAMTRYLNERLALKRKTEHIPDSVAFKHHSHLSGAWEHWQNMSPADQSSAWTLEILRSFTRSKQRNETLRTELEHSHQRTRHLEAEYDRLSRCQLPREYLLHPPNTLPITPSLMRETKPPASLSSTSYDAETLLSSWRAKIRATTRPPKPSQTSSSPIIYKENNPRRNELQDDMIMNGSVWGVGGPMPRGYDVAPPHTEGAATPPVNYETPPNPGNVVDAEDEEGVGEDEWALVRRGNAGGGVLFNQNGKRPLEGSGGSGGRGGTKLYKAHD